MPSRPQRVVAPPVVAGLMVATVLAAIVLVWSLDAFANRGEVARNVDLAGERVSGMHRDDLTAKVTSLAAGFGTTTVELHADDHTFTHTAAQLGLSVDVPTTVHRAMGVGQGGFALIRPLRWLRSFGGTRHAPVVLVVDEKQLEATVAQLDKSSTTQPVEPGFTVVDDEIKATEGKPGVGIDFRKVAERLRQVSFQRGVIRVDIPSGEVPPKYTIDDARKLISRANELTGTPVQVTAGSASTELSPLQMRRWLSSTAGPDGLQIVFDRDRMRADLASALVGAATPAKNATFALQSGQPVIQPDQPGTACCAPEAADVLLSALEQGQRGPIALPMAPVEATTTAADLAKLGIKQVVASFTTKHRAGEARVSNIHRVADLMQGTLVAPGATLSLNDAIGERTAQKGFVLAPAIVDGTLNPEIGGGVSQYMTTIFNAAFFAGLEFGEYQSHSIYISRYPFGREATINWPAPDLQIKNVSPYGVYIVNSYTSTSITVTMWSTPWVTSVEQGTQETFLSGKSCTGVKTQRIRQFLDGTQKIDFVRARYRAQEGLNCDQPLPDGVKLQAAPGQPPPSTPEDTAVTTTTKPKTSSSTTVAKPTTTTVHPTTTAPVTTRPPSTTAPSTTVAPGG